MMRGRIVFDEDDDRDELMSTGWGSAPPSPPSDAGRMDDPDAFHGGPPHPHGAFPIIFDHLAANGLNKTLLRCALACRGLHEICMPLLLRRLAPLHGVLFPPKKVTSAWLRFADAATADGRLAGVAALDMSHASRWYSRNASAAAACRRILRGCTNMAELAIHITPRNVEDLGPILSACGSVRRLRLALPYEIARTGMHPLPRYTEEVHITISSDPAVKIRGDLSPLWHALDQLEHLESWTLAGGPDASLAQYENLVYLLSSLDAGDAALPAELLRARYLRPLDLAFAPPRDPAAWPAVARLRIEGTLVLHGPETRMFLRGCPEAGELRIVRPVPTMLAADASSLGHEGRMAAVRTVLRRRVGRLAVQAYPPDADAKMQARGWFTAKEKRFWREVADEWLAQGIERDPRKRLW
ncbi:hypothetical protein DFJ74DRAFT_765293 [Hyaloraphidium curvatum]|nr:hypothetical protein DFJ74DRAFT_765293 [Hyaloraphidium curvatum]